jgi:uncharacterized delta-60 repeat protein
MRFSRKHVRRESKQQPDRKSAGIRRAAWQVLQKASATHHCVAQALENRTLFAGTPITIINPGFETLYEPGTDVVDPNTGVISAGANTATVVALPGGAGTFDVNPFGPNAQLRYQVSGDQQDPADTVDGGFDLATVQYSDGTQGNVADVPGWTAPSFPATYGGVVNVGPQVNSAGKASYSPYVGKTDNVLYLNGPGATKGGSTIATGAYATGPAYQVVSQQLATTVQPNTLYTLSVQVGLPEGLDPQNLVTPVFANVEVNGTPLTLVSSNLQQVEQAISVDRVNPTSGSGQFNFPFTPGGMEVPPNTNEGQSTDPNSNLYDPSFVVPQAVRDGLTRLAQGTDLSHDIVQVFQEFGNSYYTVLVPQPTGNAKDITIMGPDGVPAGGVNSPDGAKITVDSDGNPVGPGTFQTLTETFYTGDTVPANAPLTVTLGTGPQSTRSTAQTDFDNVTLTSEPAVSQSSPVSATVQPPPPIAANAPNEPVTVTYASAAGKLNASATDLLTITGTPASPAIITSAVIQNNVATITAVNNFQVGQKITVSGVGSNFFNGSFAITGVTPAMAGQPATFSYKVSNAQNVTSSGGTAVAMFKIGFDGMTGAVNYNPSAAAGSIQTGLNSLVSAGISGGTVFPASGAQVGPAAITNEALASDVATLTAPNSFTVGQQVIVTGMGSPFDGTFTVTAVTPASPGVPATFSYDVPPNIKIGNATAGAVAFAGASAVITNKALVSGMATLAAANSFAAGQQVTVSGVGAPFDGTVTVASSTTTTFSYVVQPPADIAAKTTGGRVAAASNPTSLAAVSKKALMTGMATLTAPNTFVVGQQIIVSGVGSPFDGTFTVSGVTAASAGSPATFSYSVLPDVPSQSASGTAAFAVMKRVLTSGVATLTGDNNFTMGQQITVSGEGSPFDGTFTVTGVTAAAAGAPATFSYDVLKDIPTQAAPSTGVAASAITLKALKAGVATITAANNFTVGQKVTVSGVDPMFNGTFIVTGVTPTSPGAATNKDFSYALPNDVFAVSNGATPNTFNISFPGSIPQVSPPVLSGGVLLYGASVTLSTTNTGIVPQNITVVGPSGDTLPATMDSSTYVVNSDGSVTATYLVQPPDGVSFTSADSSMDSYTVLVAPGSVTDTAGNANGLASTTFMVSISPPSSPIDVGFTSEAVVTVPNGPTFIAGHNGYPFDFKSGSKAQLEILPSGSTGTTAITPPLGNFSAFFGAALVPQGVPNAGDIIAVGTKDSDMLVTALSPSTGMPDPAFGTQGVFVANIKGDSTAYSVAIDPSGKIVVGGTNSNGDYVIFRLNADGTPDVTFNPGGAHDSFQVLGKGASIQLPLQGVFAVRGGGELRISSGQGGNAVDQIVIQPGAAGNYNILAAATASILLNQPGGQLPVASKAAVVLEVDSTGAANGNFGLTAGAAGNSRSNDTQVLDTGHANGGSFTLTVTGANTISINAGASAASIESALNNLSAAIPQTTSAGRALATALSGLTVSSTDNSRYTIAFPPGAMAPVITLNSALTGATTAPFLLVPTALPNLTLGSFLAVPGLAEISQLIPSVLGSDASKDPVGIALESTGDIVVVAGTADPATPSTTDFGVARLDPLGNLDPTFGTAGIAATMFGTTAYATSVTIMGQADPSAPAASSERIVVSGVSYGTAGLASAYAVYTETGQLDTTGPLSNTGTLTLPTTLSLHRFWGNFAGLEALTNTSIGGDGFGTTSTSSPNDGSDSTTRRIQFVSAFPQLTASAIVATTDTSTTDFHVVYTSKAGFAVNASTIPLTLTVTDVIHGQAGRPLAANLVSLNGVMTANGMIPVIQNAQNIDAVYALTAPSNWVASNPAKNIQGDSGTIHVALTANVVDTETPPVAIQTGEFGTFQLDVQGMGTELTLGPVTTVHGNLPTEPVTGQTPFSAPLQVLVTNASSTTAIKNQLIALQLFTSPSNTSLNGATLQRTLIRRLTLAAGGSKMLTIRGLVWPSTPGDYYLLTSITTPAIKGTPGAPLSTNVGASATAILVKQPIFDLMTMSVTPASTTLVNGRNVIYAMVENVGNVDIVNDPHKDRGDNGMIMLSIANDVSSVKIPIPFAAHLKPGKTVRVRIPFLATTSNGLFGANPIKVKVEIDLNQDSNNLNNSAVSSILTPS